MSKRQHSGQLFGCANRSLGSLDGHFTSVPNLLGLFPRIYGHEMDTLSLH